MLVTEQQQQHLYVCMHACMLSHFSCIRLFVTPWTVARQAPLFLGFSKKEYWSGLPGPPPGDPPDPEIEPTYPAAPASQVDSSLLSHQGSPYICINTHTHTHIYIYIYTHTHTHTHMCTYMEREALTGWAFHISNQGERNTDLINITTNNIFWDRIILHLYKNLLCEFKMT